MLLDCILKNVLFACIKVWIYFACITLATSALVHIILYFILNLFLLVQRLTQKDNLKQWCYIVSYKVGQVGVKYKARYNFEFYQDDKIGLEKIEGCSKIKIQKIWQMKRRL